MDNGIDCGRIAGAFGMLFAFGWLFNGVYAWAEKEGYTEGYVWFAVVIGVFVTGIGFVCAIDSFMTGLILCGCFLASGIPMIFGAVCRYVKARKQGEAP